MTSPDDPDADGHAWEGREDPAPQQAARPVGRPAPQYGEYAPEGWVNPVEVAARERERADAERRRRLAAEQAVRDQQQHGGTGGTADRGPVGPWDPPSGPPGRGPAPTGAGPRPDGTRDPRAGRARFGASPGDLLATVLLLAFGLTTVLQQVLGVGRTASTVAQELADRYVPLAHPEALVTPTAICAVLDVLLFAGAVWWSIVRLRRHRVTFWVPLAAGAVAGIVSTLAYVVVVIQDPAFAAYLSSHAG